MARGEWRPPPPGWFTFGTHVDIPGPLVFSDETDEAGMPLWERPADDEAGNLPAKACEQCGHDFDPHIVLATGTRVTHGGVIICQVKGCLCYATWDAPQLGGTRDDVVEPSEEALALFRQRLQVEDP